MAAYWGYDTFSCPTATQLTNTYNSGCRFIGYYLAPTLNKHRTNTSFMGKRATIRNHNLYPVPIYMACYYNDSGVGSKLGTQEANDAVDKAVSEGFASGTYIYLDIERPCDSSYKSFHDYVRAWVVQVGIRGYKAGIYLSADYVSIFQNTLSGCSVRYWVHVTKNHPYSGTHSTSSTAPNPNLSGFSGAKIWQCVQNENHTFSGGTMLLVDLNSSTVKNPAS